MVMYLNSLLAAFLVAPFNSPAWLSKTHLPAGKELGLTRERSSVKNVSYNVQLTW